VDATEVTILDYSERRDFGGGRVFTGQRYDSLGVEAIVGEHNKCRSHRGDPAANRRSPVAYPGISSCPYVKPGTITVRFFRSAHTREFASVFFDRESCDDVWVSLYSSTHQLLGKGEDGGDFGAIPSVTKLLGLQNAS